MADILIKGIQFPKFSPHVIEVYPDGTAIAHGKGIFGEAVPVPPHRDLIDINALKLEILNVDYVNKHDYLKGVLNAINNAPIVIPADKDGEI